MANDKLTIEILKDGTIKMTSDPISAPNHANAAEFFRTVARLSGGTTKTVRRKDVFRSTGQAHSNKETQ